MYCARTDQAMQYLTFPQLPAHDPYDQGPPVGRVFVMPDFGARVMRVTDEMSAIGNTHANEAYTGFDTSSNDGYAGFSAFNPALGTHGGYYFSFGSWEGWSYVDLFDPATMNVTPYISPTYGRAMPYFSFSWNDADVGFEISGGGSNLQLNTYCFSTASPSDPWCQSPGPDGVNGSTGVNLIYNFATSCPNYPTDIVGKASGGVIVASHDDSKFAFYYGGNQQDWSDYVFYYDKTTNTCHWLDTATGIEGGTGESPTPVANALLADPAAAPSVTANATGGSLAGPATYCVDYTILTSVYNQDGSGYPAGETKASPEQCVSMPSTSAGSLSITLPSISNPNGIPLATASGAYSKGNYNIYIGTASGAEKLQSSGASGPSYTQTAALNTSSAAPPPTSTAGWNTHYAQINMAPVPSLGAAVYIQSARSTGTNTSPIWFPTQNSIGWCINYCAGHNAHGFTHMVNGPNNYAVQTYIRPYSALNPGTSLIPKPPGGVTHDSHWAWQADNSSDSMPVIAGIFNSGSRVGNGTLNESPNPNANPLFKISAIYDREVTGISTNGSGLLFRFIHNPTTAACTWTDNAGNQSCFYGEGQEIESPDGKWLLMTSGWDFKLGNFMPNNCLNTACQWAAGTTVSAGMGIIDPNGNVETAQTGGTTGSLQPAWPGTNGGTVVDNTVTWKMTAACPISAHCRADLFMVELR